MDSQLASVLTSGSLDVQNGSQCAEGSGPVTEVFSDQEEKTSAGAVPGNPKPCPVKAAVTIRQDAVSINGKKPEVGGTLKPASQESSNAGGCRQPITVKTGVPVSRRRPIRLKIVVPPRCKRPINSAISLTKDFAHLHFRKPSSGAVSSEENKIQISAVKTEEVKKITNIKTEASFQETEADRQAMGAKIHTDGSETNLIPNTNTNTNTNTIKTLNRKYIKEETKEREIEENIPLILREIKWTSCKTPGEEATDEQTEPLDLSLPKKKESREMRCGRFMGDSGCESSLIMEVDEYEGEGDRDVVEEDDVGDLGSPDTLEDPLLSPSFFSTSVLTSLSSIDTDTENLLLIDDQGIPYTLSPDGLKVPQVDASTSDDPLSESGPAEVKGKESPPPPPPPPDPNLSQSSDNALKAPSCPSPAPAADPPSLTGGQVKTPEVFTSLVPNSEPSSAAESSATCVQASAVLSVSSAISVPPQPIQILTNPSSNTPILLLSSSSSSPQLSTSQMGLTLPLPVTPTVPGASTPMFLLLSSVPSSFGDSASTSTPIAVLDPTTGQLSQITAASAPVSLPLASGQVSTLGSPLPTLSHPIIKLSPNNPPVILPGVNNLNSDSVLASSPAVQNDSSSTPLLPSQNNSCDSNSGSEAISAAEVVSSENNKPSTLTETSLHPQSVGSTPSEAQSPSSDTQFDQSDLHSQHLPLDDHLYFANAAAPASPPDELALSSDKLPPLDPLSQMDPLSPGSATNAMGPRRVLYCQLCPRVFFYLSDLERHAITHSQKKPHVCQQCGKAFKRSSHLQVSES
ncbi:uncharacterized protein V6R79_011299 [Siganus canaliculatus]